MNNKILIKIDVTKINKDKIKERRYMKDGVEVVAKEYEMECVPLKEPKFIKRGTATNGEEWQLLKTGFVVEKKDKDSKDEPDVFLGDGLEFEKIHANSANIPTETIEEVEYPKDENSIEIPF